MVEHLAQRHSVVVASLAHTAEELEQGKALEKHCDRLIAEIVPDRVRWLNAFKALPTSVPSSVAYFWSPRLQRRINEAIQATNFDVVIVHCAFVANYVETRQRARRILDFCDLDSAKWREYGHHRRFPLSLGYAVEARKLRKYETRMAMNFDHCTVATQGEQEEFQNLGTGVPCTVVPNGVDTTHFTSDQFRRAAEPVIVFLGRMDYYPNIDGVCYFAQEIFPLVRQHIPAAQFVIVGSQPSRRVLDLKRIPGISVTGHVSDVRTYLKNAAVSIAPLRIARGTQNKVLESMAMGIPVVATPQVAKGIQAIPERHLLIAEHPHKFAEKLVEVLTNERLHRELATAASRNLNQTHTWPRSMDIIDELLVRRDGMFAQELMRRGNF
jgi:sugar transferase (PEP-CTERM/EpsH1 system associated)